LDMLKNAELAKEKREREERNREIDRKLKEK
jgi:hypothetical protein